MSTEIQPPEYSLGERTLARIRSELADHDTACVAQVIDVLRQLADRADRVSIQDLAELIGRDLTTLNKIIQVAHRLGHNPDALEVSTLAQAISVIGFNKVRSLAISLLLMESAENQQRQPEAREIAAVALASGILAQCLGGHARRVDVEEAFVGAALRHYGRLLLSSFMPAEYSAALALAGNGPIEPATRELFGLDSLELAQRLLAETGLANNLLRCLNPMPAQLLNNPDPTDADRLFVVTELAGEICEVFRRENSQGKELAEISSQLLKGRRNVLNLDEKQFEEVLVQVSDQIEAMSKIGGAEAFACPLIRRIQAVAVRQDTRDAAGAAGHLPSAAGPTTDDESALGTLPADDPLPSMLQAIHAWVKRSPSDAPGILGLTAQAACTAIAADSCVVFCREACGALYLARVGTGDAVAGWLGSARLDANARTVFRVCLTQGEDVLIQDPEDDRIRPFLPPWFEPTVRGRAFLLLPIADELGTFAVLCVISSPRSRISLPAVRAHQLKEMRKWLAPLGKALRARPKAA